MTANLVQRDFSEQEFQELHDIIFPADIRVTDAVRALVRKTASGQPFQDVRVWRMSPLGVELLPDKVSQFAKGELLDLQLIVGNQSTNFEGLVVAVAPEDNERNVLGVRLSKKHTDTPQRESSRRRGSRWICSSQFDPICMAANPLQFNDFLYFKIRDISKSGIKALTSLRNKFIVPGMELQAQISFPLTSQVSLPLRVARVNLTAEHGKDYLEIGLEFLDLSRHQREVIGQYLIQFSDAQSLRAIRDEGFFPTSLTKGIDYQFAKTADEFKEVLELRLLANRVSEKIPDHYTAEDMADIYDMRSRIVVGRYRGQVVATMRLTFNELGQKLEHEQYLELPPDFPRSEQILEIARAATHPDFRANDLWTTLMQHAAIAAIQAKRPWVLMSTTAELRQMYLRLGCKDTGLRYRHPLYPDKEQIVMHINLRDVVVGQSVGPIYWNVVWKSVGTYLAQLDSTIAADLTSARVRFYSLLSPLAQLLRYFSSRPRKQRR